MAEVALAASLVAPAAVAGEPGPARQEALGALVRQDCGSCHGMTLKGGLGSPLLPADLEGKPADALAEVILGGIEGTPMPAWRDLLSEEEARWIARELKEGSFTQ